MLQAGINIRAYIAGSEDLSVCPKILHLVSDRVGFKPWSVWC